MSEQEKETSTAAAEVIVKVGPAEVTARGYRIADVLGIVWGIALCLLVYIAYDTQQDVKVAAATLATATKEDHRTLQHAIDKGTEAQQEQSYILTLDQAGRERLSLRMPESLRRKVQ